MDHHTDQVEAVDMNVDLLHTYTTSSLLLIKL